MTQLSIEQGLKFAELQMAAGAFIRLGSSFRGEGVPLRTALTDGNGHNSKFTPTQALEFSKHWKALDQRETTATGFNGTLFKCIADDPLTGAKAGERVIALRSTEFIDDHVRDNRGTNRLEIVEFGFEFGQLRDLEQWYAEINAAGGLLGGRHYSVVGYCLGGHLATAFNLMHRGEVQQVVTFNGTGAAKIGNGSWRDTMCLPKMVAQLRALRAYPEVH